MTAPKVLIAIVLLAVAAGCASGPAISGSKVELADDASRSDLLRYGASLNPTPMSLPREFVFPTDVVERGLFGIDVSHHQGKVNWKNVFTETKVSFVYIKATQGVDYYDKRFAANWKAVDKARLGGADVHRGAYHFLSADSDGALQAQNFAGLAGPHAADDLPPCLDMEWDFDRLNGEYVLDDKGQMVDRWSKYTSADIIAKAKIWLEAVELATGKKPIIYTNTYWWKTNIGADLSLAGYKLWVSDYTRGSLQTETPGYPTGHAWVLWQLTDRGRLPGPAVRSIDVNIFPGTAADFRAWCCGASGPAPVAAVAQ